MKLSVKRNIIRKTKSICPVCFNVLEAFVIEEDGKVFLQKECLQHGEFEILLSHTPSFYKALDKFYFSVMPHTKYLSEYEMWVTMKCNTQCPICHLGDLKQIDIPEPSCAQIEEFIKKDKAPFYILSGGEPTCRKDLFEIVRIFKKQGKKVSINTNGLKLMDKGYLKHLKDAGIDRVNLQFDGFCRESYKKFRGKDILDKKIKILNNLKDLNISTDLNVTIAKEINEGEVKEIIDYAVGNNFISAVNFFTICYLGQSSNWPMSHYIMPDEIGDILEKKTGGRIRKENIYLFQKLHLAIKSFFNQKFCLYSQIFILFRQNGYYVPVNKYLNLKRAEYLLDAYQNVYKKNRVAGKIMLLFGLPVALLKWSSFLIFKEIALMVFYKFQKNYHLKNRKILYFNFNTSCDPYKINFSLTENCQDEIIYADKTSGLLKNQGADGLRAIEFEKKFVKRKRCSCM